MIDIDGYGTYDTEYEELHRGVFEEPWEAEAAADEYNRGAWKWNPVKEEYETPEPPQRYVAVKVIIKEIQHEKV